MARWTPRFRWAQASRLAALVLTVLTAATAPTLTQAAAPADAGVQEGEVAPDPMLLPQEGEAAPDPMLAPAEQDPMAMPPAGSDSLSLQLDVKINGYATGLIAGFSQQPDGHLASLRSELTDIGIAVPGEGAADEVIVLDSIPGLSYVYDETAQAVELEVPDSLRIAKQLSHGGEAEEVVPQSSNGLAVNYTAFAGGDYQMPSSKTAFDGANLTLDARAFSKFGTLRQTGVVGTTTFADATVLRLDTTWSYSSQKSMRTYRIGDIVSGNLRWTRAVRLGGVQVQRNFALRPDLVTMPLPQIKGTAEVPSVVDIYLGQAKAFSGDVEPGPFTMDDLPVFTDSGTARIVLTDVSGRSIETDLPFYTSPQLLKKGLADYSIESGVVRRDYGTDSFGYDDAPVGLASLRYGLTDAITLEAHAEGKSDLINAGFGATVLAKQFGVFTGAVAGSRFGHDMGFHVYGSWQARLGPVSVYASTSRRFGKYYDLAAATVAPVPGKPLTTNVPLALDQVSLSYTIPRIDVASGLSLIHQKTSKKDETLLLSGSLSKTFHKGTSVYATGYWDFLDKDGYGAYLGVSVPLGKTYSLSASGTYSKDDWVARTDVSRPMGQNAGDYGWRLSHSEGKGFRASELTASYRSHLGIAEGGVYQQGSQVAGHAAFSGSVAVAGGGIFAGPQIGDAFAVVKAGAPGVEVYSSNTLVGKTNASGNLLVPNLRSFQKNPISIDVTDLPITATSAETSATVMPREGAGVVVDFGVKKDAGGVLVTVVDEAGKPLDVGLEAQLNGAGETFIVGYDGEVFVTGAADSNKLAVTLADGTCEAAFTYKPDGTGQTAVGPVTCARAN